MCDKMLFHGCLSIFTPPISAEGSSEQANVSTCFLRRKSPVKAFYVEPREPEGSCEASGMIPCVAETMLAECC